MERLNEKLSVFREFVFKGDEEDRRTKAWGVRRGKIHRVRIVGWDAETIVTEIETEGGKFVRCPYRSIGSFLRNWEAV